MKRVNVSRMRERITLGVMSDRPTPSGICRPSFQATRTLWCGTFTLSMRQWFTVLGTHDTTSKTVFIRHLAGGLSETHAKIGDHLYTIEHIHPEADDTPKSFDILVLGDVSKNG